MKVYFMGLDLPGLTSTGSERSGLGIDKPTLVQDISNISVRFDALVYKKLGTEGTWFIRGEGVSGEVELFSSSLNVSDVCFASNFIVGINYDQNTMYKADLNVHVTTHGISWEVKKVSQPDKSVAVKQVVTNDKSIYVLDDRSSVFELTDTLALKWQFGDDVEIVKIACGFNHFVALSSTGALYSWGNGGRGELGHFDSDHVMVKCEEPKRIEFFDDLPCIVKDIACGGWHTLALTSDGDVYSWGWNESGQLGHSVGKLSAVGGIPYPIDLGSAEDPITLIACGARHSIAVTRCGHLYTWGLNKHGQLGVGDHENKPEPTRVPDVNGVVKVICGRWSTFLYVK